MIGLQLLYLESDGTRTRCVRERRSRFLWVKLWEVADVVAEFRRKGLLFRDFAGKDFESV